MGAVVHLNYKGENTAIFDSVQKSYGTLKKHLIVVSPWQQFRNCCVSSWGFYKDVCFVKHTANKFVT